MPRGLSFSKHVNLDDKDDNYEIDFFQMTGPLQNKTEEDYICVFLGGIFTYLFHGA